MGWSDLEMAELKVGDKRLNKRVKHTIEKLAASSESSFPACFKTRAELIGAYRLFDNDFLTPEKILEPHYKSVKQRAKTYPVVLLLNDTSSLDYTSKDVEGLGMLEKNYTRGLFIHPTLAITPDRQCLGLIGHGIWTRMPNQHRNQISGSIRGNQPIEEKESFRWLESYRQGCLFAESIQETGFVFIADRESDILELLAEAVKKKEQTGNIDILIRAKHDRVLIGEVDEKKLKKTMAKAPVSAQIKFQIPGRGTQKSRKVEQSIRVKQVMLQGKEVNGKNHSPVQINAVLCVEESPPAGVEPIVWLLLTTLPINDEEQVLRIIKYYLCRWEIETFFNVLKNGCNVEARELKTADRLKNMIALFMIVSWRVMFLMNLGRQNPNKSCDEVFENAEWMSVCSILNKKVPKEPPRLGEFMIMVGRLGGYQPRKSPPGVKVIWEGLKRMTDYALMWETVNAQYLSIKSCV
jgi:hypothetical protein